jgi:hypothetical protein
MIENILLLITVHFSTVYKQLIIKNLLKKQKMNSLNKKIKFN